MFKRDKRPLIVALSMLQAKEAYMEERGLRFNEVIVISSLNHARGYKNKKYVMVGQWWLIPEIYAIQEYARTHGWREIKES